MSRFYRLWNPSILVGLLFSILAVSSASLASGKDASTSAAPMRVAVLIFPWVELLDFAAPAEIFAGVRDEEGEALFEVYTVAPNKNVLERLRFLSITPQYEPTDAPAPDILMSLGAMSKCLINNQRTLDWNKRQAEAKCLQCSVCNGASILGKLGLLDCLQVATHHDNIALLTFIAPKATCRPDRKFVGNEQIVTAAGISTGIDSAPYVVTRSRGDTTWPRRKRPRSPPQRRPRRSARLPRRPRLRTTNRKSSARWMLPRRSWPRRRSSSTPSR